VRKAVRYLEERGVMHESIDGSECHGRIGEDLSPFAKGLICRDEQRTPLISGADQLEQHRGFRLVLADVRDVVEDEQIEVVQAVDRGLEGQFAASDLQLLHQIRGTGEQNPVALLQQCQPDRGAQMRLASARRPEQDQVGSLIQPNIPGA